MDFLLSILSDIIAAIIVVVVPWFVYRIFGWRFFIEPLAVIKGWHAEDDEFNRNQNPYPKGTLKHDAWNDGYDASTETKEPGSGK